MRTRSAPGGGPEALLSSSGAGSPSSSSDPRAGGPPGSESKSVTPERRRSDQLDARHGGVVPVTRAQLEDAGVAAGPVGVAGPDLLEQLVGHVLVPDERDHLALMVHAALAGL